MKKINFSKNFTWGVATAAHQIEGYNNNSDWWQWEQQPGKIFNNQKSGKATDHWNRLEEDVTLLCELGVQKYRFSIEWAKIEPKKGIFNKEAIAFYKKEINLLLKNNITPVVTLHHFVNPLWFTNIGGWESDEAPELFMEYVNFVYKHIGNLVNFWVTINEPMVLVTGGYIAGLTPPGKTSFQIVKPMRNLLLSHAKAYHFLHKQAKKEKREIKVGLSHHLRIIQPARWWHPMDQGVAMTLNKEFNWTVPIALKTGTLKISIPGIMSYKEKIPELKKTQDYIGVNYYSRQLVQYVRGKQFCKLIRPRRKQVTDNNWEIYPTGFLHVLKIVNKLYPETPIIITENGIADAKDNLRIEFIKSHLYQIYKAIKKGINIQGYIHWSLMDNFEWLEGFQSRFGLYKVNFNTFERTARKSAVFYKKLIANNGFIIKK